MCLLTNETVLWSVTMFFSIFLVLVSDTNAGWTTSSVRNGVCVCVQVLDGQFCDAAVTGVSDVDLWPPVHQRQQRGDGLPFHLLQRLARHVHLPPALRPAEEGVWVFLGVLWPVFGLLTWFHTQCCVFDRCRKNIANACVNHPAVATPPPPVPTVPSRAPPIEATIATTAAANHGTHQHKDR